MEIDLWRCRRFRNRPRYLAGSFFCSSLPEPVPCLPGQAGDDGEVEDHAVEIALPGEIHGAKWNDMNGNGQWDAAEPALAGGHNTEMKYRRFGRTNLMLSEIGLGCASGLKSRMFGPVTCRRTRRRLWSSWH